MSKFETFNFFLGLTLLGVALVRLIVTVIGRVVGG